MDPSRSHLTIHYNGWGNYPNPGHFTTKHIHAFFESDFVDRYANASAVQQTITAYRPSNSAAQLSQEQIAAIVSDYLGGTAAQVVPLYRLYNTGAFDSGSKDAIAFTDAQLARGATMLRDAIALAWEDSLNQNVGYPPIAVRDVLSGKVNPISAPL